MTVASTAVKNDKKALLSLKRQILNLSQFVVKLTTFYQGGDPSLEAELKTLRANLSSPATFSAAETSIGRLTDLIMEISGGIKEQNRQSSDLLKHSIQNLQTRSGLPNAIQQKVHKISPTLLAAPSSLLDSLICFEQIITLYQEILEQGSPAVKTPSPSSSLETSASQAEASEEYQDLIDELSTLLGGLILNNSQDSELLALRNQLRDKVDQQTLLQCCRKVITVLSKNTRAEGKDSENFIEVLQDSLTEVNQKVNHSIEGVEQRFNHKEQNTDVLLDQITGIEKAVDNSGDLQQLKTQARDYLTKMSSTLGDRKHSDKEEQLELMSLLNDMQSKLSSMDDEAQEYKRRLAEQKQRSNRDPLTKLANRTAYNQRVELEYLRWRRSKLPLSIAVLDIDNFKNINDTYGHAAGDKTLQVIAQTMTKAIRNTDFLARWGGEEFIILFPDTDNTGLTEVVEKIRRKIEAIPFKFKDAKVTITLSIGATDFAGNDTAERAFERADNNLYEAKNTGRNRCVLK